MEAIIKKHKISAVILALFISAAGFFGCGDTTVNPAAIDNLSFSSTGSMDSIGDQQNVLILDTVKILIKDIKVTVNNSSEDSVNFKTGPFVLFLNLSSNVQVISTSIVPAGDYKKIKFEVHKLNSNEIISDPDFMDSLGTYSVVVKGRYLGNYFVYKSDKSAHQQLSFPSPYTISASVLTNLTLVVKPYIWFIENGIYVDPTNPLNRNDIDNNIKDNVNHNFKAFRDNNKDGIPD
jgi:hypothetical protein